MRFSIAIGFDPSGVPSVLYCGTEAADSLAAAEAGAASGLYAECAHFRNPEPEKVRRSDVPHRAAAAEAEAAKDAAAEAAASAVIGVSDAEPEPETAEPEPAKKKKG